MIVADFRENYDLHCCNAFNLQCLSKQFHSNYLIENGEL